MRAGALLGILLLGGCSTSVPDEAERTTFILPIGEFEGNVPYNYQGKAWLEFKDRATGTLLLEIPASLRLTWDPERGEYLTALISDEFAEKAMSLVRKARVVVKPIYPSK